MPRTPPRHRQARPMNEDRPSSAHQARASAEVDAPPGHLCVNEVLLHAGDGYGARRGSADAANDHPSIGEAALSADPDDVENADQPGRLVDVGRQDPTTETEHRLAEAGSSPGGSTTTSHGTSARSAARSTSASWHQPGRPSLGCCLARLAMSRARTSPMAGSWLAGSGSGRCAWIW
jgi:hypothetical protein